MIEGDLGATGQLSEQRTACPGSVLIDTASRRRGYSLVLNNDSTAWSLSIG